MSDGWRGLLAELDRWAEAGRTATLWWRDDDAAAPGAALDRLVDLATAHRVPLCLAVVPGRLDTGLAGRLAAAGPGLAVLQHGWRHENHAPAGEKKCELGGHRPPAAVLGELTAGRARLEAAFGARFLPVLVPPWNRIAGEVATHLAGAGFRGLSLYGPRPAADRDGLRLVNTHADPIDWRGGGGFVGEAPALAMVVEHLQGRRTGRMDVAEPTGLLTHHLVHGQVLWRFLDRLLTVLVAHPAIHVEGARRVFGLGEA
ncbi:MAG: polysaccharide deacetylase family protein [Azospirillaceae bacterium]